MNFMLLYYGEEIARGKTLDELLSLVAEDVASYEAEKSQNPEWFDESDEFDFENYEVLQKVNVDFKKILTTNKRGTIPKSWRAEGENFID